MMRFQVVPAAYVILLREREGSTQVLLQLRQNTGYRDGHWACGAAGHVEEGESAYDAAVREAREELGITVSIDALEPLTALHRTHGNGQAIDERVDFFFLARTWEGEPVRVEGERTVRIGWFDLADLPAPVVPHELHVLRMLGSRAEKRPPAITAFGFQPE